MRSLSPSPNRIRSLVVSILALGSIVPLTAAPLYWDPNGSEPGMGGSGTWNFGPATSWNTGSTGGGSQQAWINGTVTSPNSANFGGSGGSVNVAYSGEPPIITNVMTISVGDYEFTGNAIHFQAPQGDAQGKSYGGTIIDVTSGSGNTRIDNNLVIRAPDGTDGARYIIKNASSGILTINGNTSFDMTAPAVATKRSYDIDQTSATGRIILNGTFGNPVGETATASLRFGENSGHSSATYEVNGNNTGNLLGGASVIRGTVLLGNALALGSANVNISVGSGSTRSGDVAALLTNGAMTVARNIVIGNSGNINAQYVVGGNTAEISTFSGNITTHNQMPLFLRAAAGGEVTFSGQVTRNNVVISGVTYPSGLLVKDGEGTVYLTRATGNSGTGDAEVREGTLLVTNTDGSAHGSGNLTVKAGATLGGTGRIAPSLADTKLTIESGGTLLGGQGLTAGGTLTVVGTTEFLSGAIIKLVLGPGLDNSSIARGGGAWTFQADQVFSFSILNGATAGTYTGILTGLATGIDVSGWQIAPESGLSGSFITNGTSVDLVVSAIPEPSAFLLLGIGLLFVVFIRRKTPRTCP